MKDIKEPYIVFLFYVVLFVVPFTVVVVLQ